jgi:hypothetical protein
MSGSRHKPGVQEIPHSEEAFPFRGALWRRNDGIDPKACSFYWPSAWAGAVTAEHHDRRSLET